MHELGLVTHVVRAVEEIAEENQLSRVASVTLEIGEVSGIVPDYLTDAWVYFRKRTDIMQQADLIIEMLPAVTFCESCEQTYPTVEHGKICPHCGSNTTYLLTGNEFIIKEIEAC